MHDFRNSCRSTAFHIDSDIVFFAAGLEAFWVQHSLALFMSRRNRALRRSRQSFCSCRCVRSISSILTTVFRNDSSRRRLAMNFIVKFNGTEDFLVCQEVYLGATFAACTYNRHGTFHAFLHSISGLLLRHAQTPSRIFLPSR